MSVLLAEYAGGMLAQKAADGHCPKEAPCAKASNDLVRLLEEYRAALSETVGEIDGLLAKTRGGKGLDPELARSMGLRD
jgi:hypothetical protein